MSILTNQQKTKIYEKEVWKWQNKMIPLKHMDTNMLDVCLKFVKRYPKGILYGKNKHYWIEALEHLIKFKSNNDVNKAISMINEHKIAKANIIVNNIYSSFKKDTIIGKIKTFENNFKIKEYV